MRWLSYEMRLKIEIQFQLYFLHVFYSDSEINGFERWHSGANGTLDDDEVNGLRSEGKLINEWKENQWAHN